MSILQNHLDRMTRQLVDSSLATTREYWRLKLGATPEQARDPRSFVEVVNRR